LPHLKLKGDRLDCVSSDIGLDVGERSCDGVAMTESLERHNRPVSDHLHPRVYAAVAGCALWFVLSAWTFFSGSEPMGLLLAVVSGFFLMATLIPFALWLTWRRRSPDAGRLTPDTLREWMSGEFKIGQGRRKALDAMIEILLPLAAAAIGMTALGLIFHFCATSAAQWTS
jgi:hypothetical protein